MVKYMFYFLEFLVGDIVVNYYVFNLGDYDFLKVLLQDIGFGFYYVIGFFFFRYLYDGYFLRFIFNIYLYSSDFLL